MLKLPEQRYRGEQAFRLQKRKHTLGMIKLCASTEWVAVAPHCGKNSQRQNKTKALYAQYEKELPIKDFRFYHICIHISSIFVNKRKYIFYKKL